MSTDQCQSVKRDERTVAIENIAYKWGYILFAYGLLVDVVYRGVVRREAAWDLLALVVVSGALCTIYQARQKTLAQGWGAKAVLIACIGGVIAFVAAFVLMHFTMMGK